MSETAHSPYFIYIFYPTNIKLFLYDSVEQVLISTSETSKCLGTVRAFLLQQENANEQVKLVNSLEKIINLKKINTMKQTTIDRFMS